MFSQATYIWLDGHKPTQKLRSKRKIFKHPEQAVTLETFPEWSFDGSSTYQAEGSDSDLLLQPVTFVSDPILGEPNYLVLCEVLNPDGTPHNSNQRTKLVATYEKVKDQQPWLGFEQEYTLFKGSRPLGWPDTGYPAPQGPFYCGVGADEVFGRHVVDEHAQACIDANIMLYGTNPEVMPGQWEFQIGYRGVDGESADPVTVSDHLWLARWLLYRIGEDYGITATLHPKPVQGDWNGAGKHTNFSTTAMRDPNGGVDAINKAIDALSKRHQEHVMVYGAHLEQRLTGAHETASIEKFSSGISDRGASIRVSNTVIKKGCGYLEDRRPGANADPYKVANILLETICLQTVSA